MNYALITGGSRGIGRAVAVRLAGQGYHILLNYKSNHAEAEVTRAAVEQAGVRCELLPFDVASPAAVDEALEGWLAAHPEARIEVLVNNAGIRQDSLFIWLTPAQWQGVLATSLDSFFYVTRHVLSQMLAARFGRIINVVSLSGQKGLPGQTNYSAAKAGLIGATKALAQEVARRGVTVNAVAPGFIRTDMTSDLNEKELVNLIPMRRFGEPEEVADAVGFLASRASSYITGEVLSINGGLYS